MHLGTEDTSEGLTLCLLQTRSLVLEFPWQVVEFQSFMLCLSPSFIGLAQTLFGQEGLNWALPSIHRISGFSLAGQICSAQHFAGSLAHVVLSESLWTE